MGQPDLFVGAGPVALLTVALLGCGATRTTATGEAANAIYIETTDAPDEAYRKAAQLLEAFGYTIQERDPALRSLTTAEQDIGSASRLRLVLNVLERILEDSPTRIQLTGWLINDVLGEGRVEATRMGGTAMRKAWQEMEQIVMQYSGAKIVYERID